MTVTIYTDAAKNTVSRVVNRYGKKVAFDNGGYRIGLFIEESGEEIRHYNTRVTDSFAAETFGILKAVEEAARRAASLEPIVIRFNGGSPQETRSRDGNKYVAVMRKIIQAGGLNVTFEPIDGAENKADRVSRSEEERKEEVVAYTPPSEKEQARRDAEMKVRRDAEKAAKRALKQAVRAVDGPTILAEINGWKTVTERRAAKLYERVGLDPAEASVGLIQKAMNEMNAERARGDW